ncbi:hypothetical protein [Methylobacterium sp. Leaf106]|uniref:hypothetical protein n=1 Tax=Methylobacterium sp. Leaf106 TaxID=1736255 RepID=UPI0006FCBE70|nr:hypothetical protein [Methylobacterium sp. Leaf106]KQP53072.1 hypothetical protein ASF34_01505 [Methylobacterium sp. Leaf106]
MTTPSLTNPNPKRDGAAAGYFDSLMQIVAWVREAQQIPQPENSISIDDVDADEIEAAAYFIDRIYSPGDPVRAALEEAVAFLEMDDEASTPGTDLYTWLTVVGRPLSRAALSVSTPTGEGEELEIIQHVKSKGLYEVVTRDAQVQTDTPLSDYAFVCVYRNAITGVTWVRPVSEMDDGRFVTVRAVAPTSASKSSGEEA